ncbi:MAG: non-canonical purine NTP pyrophosphatase [Sandaracinaceae bacterium]
MHRLRPHDALVIASHNRGKVKEIAELLAPLALELRSLAELGLPEPDETGDSFVANALLKARAAADASGLAAIADDSGLSVRALDGAPGIYAARWAGPQRDFRGAMDRIERELAGVTDRGASMHTALALAWPDGDELVREGVVLGRLVWPPRGELGFGYEPMFVPDGEARTYGEMPRSEKHRDDPRARAFAAIRAAL